jgi:hypothetical protein
LQICADYSHPGPKTTQPSSHSWIIGDQESPRFFPFHSFGGSGDLRQMSEYPVPSREQ